MSTVRDLIRGSLRLIGAVATGETPSADEQTDALSVLNDMIDSWSTERLLIYSIIREEFPLVVGQQSYTIGAAGNFNTTRPMRIEHAGIKISGTNPIELPMNILNRDEWAGIVVKSTQSSIPTMIHSEGTYPLDTLDLWPVPSATNTLVLYSWKALTSFASVNTTLALPQGYAKALRYNLALELAPEYGKTASDLVVEQAAEAKGNIKRMNIRPSFLGVDDALLSERTSFNWLTGE